MPTNLRVNPLYIQVGHIIPTNLRVNPLYIQVGHIYLSTYQSGGSIKAIVARLKINYLLRNALAHQILQ
jgi:hypothetical protein